jgi:hypothetical protein
MQLNYSARTEVYRGLKVGSLFFLKYDVDIEVLAEVRKKFPGNTKVNILGSTTPIDKPRIDISFCETADIAEVKNVNKEDIVLYTHLKNKTKRFFALLQKVNK